MVHCRIRIKGHLNSFWQQWFEQLEIMREEAGTALFCGDIEDYTCCSRKDLSLEHLPILCLRPILSFSPISVAWFAHIGLARPFDDLRHYAMCDPYLRPLAVSANAENLQ